MSGPLPLATTHPPFTFISSACRTSPGASEKYGNVTLADHARQPTVLSNTITLETKALVLRLNVSPQPRAIAAKSSRT